MLTDQELEALLTDLESDRVERKESASDRGRLCQAICALANDMPDHRKPGVLFIGVRDDGTCANLAITDQLLTDLANIRGEGNILPVPTMIVQKQVLRGCTLAVVVIEPCDAPPVRYHGRVWIRVGPRRATATPEEERRLNEKRRSRDLPFDVHGMTSASLADLDLVMFERDYLPAAVAPEVIEANRRTREEQLASLRFTASMPPYPPTVLGLLVIGKSPADLIPGAYVQFLRIDGDTLADPVVDQQEIHGPLPQLMLRLDDLIGAHIRTTADVQTGSIEVRRPDYPRVALQQLIRNAVMHRDYQTSNAPVRITWFTDRIEIQNPGGPFGQVTRANFGSPGITDYRNPHVAEAMKTLGFVQRFGMGIPLARKTLQDNGNPEPEFTVQDSYVLVTVRR